MQRRPVVVDGSNLATEGRSVPSLAQLDEAVRAWLAENADDEVIVVVDASFSYRVDESERAAFEEAEDAGEVISPPAGAVGRGDGFLLRIADRAEATVLSNDSFQEFHGEYPWLFESGRLVGGKPVPGVGWIFTPRTPVRGPKSRISVRDAKRSRKPARSEPVVEAIAEATAEAMEPDGPPPDGGGRQRRRSESDAPESINEPLPFVKFIAEHRLGTQVDGTVEAFTSHGAFVMADGARCYVPVSGLADPPPRSAKTVLTRGETRSFVVQALDPPRRGIELALPEVAHVAGAPTDETVEAEIGARGRGRGADPNGAEGRPRRRRGSSRRTADAANDAPPVPTTPPPRPPVTTPPVTGPTPVAEVVAEPQPTQEPAPEAIVESAVAAPAATPKRAPRATKAAKAAKATDATKAAKKTTTATKAAKKATKATKATATKSATKSAQKATKAAKAAKKTTKATTAPAADVAEKPAKKAAKTTRTTKATKKASKASARGAAGGSDPPPVS